MLVMDSRDRSGSVQMTERRAAARGEMIEEASNQRKPIRYKGKRFTRDRAVEL